MGAGAAGGGTIAGLPAKQRLMIWASTSNLEDALVERDQSGTQFCPKIIRGHGVKLFENICLLFKCAWMERVDILEVDNMKS